MRYRRAIVPGATYFFTLITYQRTRPFSNPDNVARWHRAVAKVQSKRYFTIEAEVLLPDHIHMIWDLPEGDADYATRIRLAKSAFTKELPTASLNTPSNDSRATKGERTVWQRRYWEHVIRDENDFHAHVDYIHINPVKHGLVAQPGEWPHSTFRSWLERGAYDPWWGTDDMPPLPDWAGRE
jgi:putative transposase